MKSKKLKVEKRVTKDTQRKIDSTSMLHDFATTSCNSIVGTIMQYKCWC